MSHIYLQDVRSALPEWEVTSEAIAQWCDCDVGFIRDKIGIQKRRLLRPEESSIDLAAQACAALFAGAPLEKSAIDLLVFVTQNPEYGLPHSAALLQHCLELGTRTACFDLGLGCSGYVYGLSVARAMMLAENHENALLVTCDPYSRIMRQGDKNTVAVFGDAATASWLGRTSGASMGKCDFGTDGHGAGALTLETPRRGSCLPPSTLYMNGRSVFNFMLRRVPASVEACLQKNALSMKDIDYFVFHQASRFMLETLVARMGLPQEKTPILLDSVGNTVSSSIPLVLEQLRARGLLRNKKVLVSGFGVGLSWATNILYF